MKNYEELHTRAVDGSLDANSRARLDGELTRRGQPPGSIERERAFLSMLAAKAPQPALDNPDFFNSALLERIRREDAAAAGSASPARARAPGVMPAWARFAWGGAACLTVALAMTTVLRPHDRSREQALTTRILSLHEFAEGSSATVLASPDNHYAVVWIDGIDHLPAGARIQ